MSLDTRSNSVSLNPLASAIAVAGPREQAVIDCIAIFYEEGKGGENYRKKNKFRCRIDKEEKRLVKFRDSKNSYSSAISALTEIIDKLRLQTWQNGNNRLRENYSPPWENRRRNQRNERRIVLSTFVILYFNVLFICIDCIKCTYLSYVGRT